MSSTTEESSSSILRNRLHNRQFQQEDNNDQEEMDHMTTTTTTTHVEVGDEHLITNPAQQQEEQIQMEEIASAPTQPSSDNIPSTSHSKPTEQQQQQQEEKEERNDLFECNICFDPASEPVITVCGHLFCWPCLYKWLNAPNNKSQQCPVCKAGIEKDKIIPIYGRGGSSSSQATRNKSANIHEAPSSASSSHSEQEQIPNRPRGQRPTAPPNPNYNPFAGHSGHPFQHGHPFANFGGGGGIGFGFGGSNFQFAEGFSFFPFFGGLGFQSSWSRSGTTATTSGVPLSDAELFDDNALRRGFISRLLWMLGVIILLTIIFL